MIVFTDVDGTLYDYSGHLPQSAVEAIRKMRKNGHKVFMVTGRSKAENKQELWDIGFDGMIGGNGSYVEADGQAIMHQTIERERCRHIVDWLNGRGLDFYEECNDGLYASEHFVENVAEPLKNYMIGKNQIAQGTETLQVDLVIHGLVEGQELYRDDVNKVSFILHSYDDYLEAVKEFPDLKVGTWGGRDEQALFGDIGVRDVDKAKAIQLLLDHLGASRDDTYAIGDASVDIPMLQYCKIGIAVGSGSEEVKAAADYVTDDVDQDGFYKAFKHFGLF